ncbi:MAG: HAMP domain-containing protein [Candidatus Methylomirabilales bacterium]
MRTTVFGEAETRQQAMVTLGEGSASLPGTITGSISRRLSLLLGLIFVVVLLIGGVSLFAARAIYLSTEDIERQGQHVEVMDSIHAAVHHLISAVQQSIITGVPYPDDEQEKLHAELHVLLERYWKLEEMEGDFAEEERETKIYREIKETIAGLIPLSDRLFNAVARGQAIDRRDLELLTAINLKMPGQAHEMNEIHQIKINRSIRESWNRMWLILSFYLAFIVIGSLLILGSNLVFHRTIVLPIRRLASATLEVASGDFRKRVSVTSRDEIGQLAHSFNVMAERLAEHEEKLKGLAVLEERERIAREMHDGLAQALGALHLQTTRAQELQKANETVRVQDAMERIRKMAEGAYEDIRQAIFGLRTMVSKRLGLIPTLIEYLHEWSRQNGVAADLQISDERGIKLSPEAELQLIRIIQEALANVRKHAAARHARIRFELEGDHVVVTVADDGKGYDPAELPGRTSKCFGLEMMRERAESVGGTLEVQSQPDRGTSVVVRLPFPGERRL